MSAVAAIACGVAGAAISAGIRAAIEKAIDDANRNRITEWQAKQEHKHEEIRNYWKYGTIPSSVDCVYDLDGRLIWNEMTGICGPAACLHWD